MERLNNNYDYVKVKREDLETIKETLDNLTLDTSRITCFASFTDDQAERVSEYDSSIAENLFSLADAIRVYANMIDDKVGKVYHTIVSDTDNPIINHNE